MGLAWPGVVCKDQEFSKVSFNTGLVSFLNSGWNQTIPMVSENLAHEVFMKNGEVKFVNTNCQDWSQFWSYT